MAAHPILRGLPLFRPLIKRSERITRERDKLQEKIEKLRKRIALKDQQIANLEGRVAQLEGMKGVPPASPTVEGGVTPNSSNLIESFAEVKMPENSLEKPRFEKFPYAGPFPWLDQPDAEEQIDAKVAAGVLSEAEAGICRVWSREGYFVLKRALEPELLDEVWAAYEQAIADGTVPLQPESVTPDDPWPGRFLDVHLKVPAFCRVLRHPTLLAWVERLMERKPAPFQTISSHKGSQQKEHSDSIHMTTYPIGYLSACWIAFEDIHPDSGPLVYYPGSHRWPYVFSHDVGIDEDDYRRTRFNAYHEKYEPHIQHMLTERQARPHYFLAKKGDVLFWHANLIHGGSPRRDLRHSRRAMVNHYLVEGAVCYHDLSASNPKPYSGTCIVEAGRR
ncbi:MAG: phytanoyl-CoA dioxygenase family protein [Chthoniobacterales bacterium]